MEPLIIFHEIHGVTDQTEPTETVSISNANRKVILLSINREHRGVLLCKGHDSKSVTETERTVCSLTKQVDAKRDKVVTGICGVDGYEVDKAKETN